MVTLTEAKKILESMVGISDIKIKEYEKIVEPLYHFITYLMIKYNSDIDTVSKKVENYCINSINRNNSEIIKTKDGIFNEISKYYSEYAKNENYIEYEKIKIHQKQLMDFMFDVFGKDLYNKKV